jgi:CubicO group peptidase (beta-lactamase class C family)
MCSLYRDIILKKYILYQRDIFMKQLLFLLLIIISLQLNCSSDPYQYLEGIWQGNMSYEKYQTRTALKIKKSIWGNINSVIDFPDYGSLDVPVNKMVFKGDSLYFEVHSIEGRFSGIINKSDSTIAGLWDQGEFDLNGQVILKFITPNTNRLLDYMVPRLDKNNKREESYFYEVPTELNDGWETASVTEVGINPENLKEMFRNVLNENYKNIHSFLIVKDGKLVCEEYFYGFHYNMQHKLASVTKSVTSSLVGIAVDKKYIKSVDEKLITYFPEYTSLFDENKRKITLHHLLSMSAGIKWKPVSFEDTSNSLTQLVLSKNTVEYVLSQTMQFDPGEKGVYNSGLSLLLGQVVEKASKMPLLKFAQKYLFEPLEITDYEWFKYFDGRINTGGNLCMKPRDMAKFGNLFLNNGKYKGKQIISEEWVKLSTQHHTNINNRNYAYHWWINSMNFKGKNIRAYSAQGLGGEFIFVFPGYKMVIVSTAGNYEDFQTAYQQLEMIYKYILPSIEENDSILLNMEEFR